MKLNEISMINADDMSDSAIRSKIRTMTPDKFKPFTKMGDVELKHNDGTRHHDFIFVKDGKTSGYAWLHKAKIDDIDGYYVTEIGLVNELRNKGIGLEFYKTLLNKGYTLFSGMTQTPDGKKTWQKIMKLPGVEISVWNDDDGEEHIVDGDVDPWADDFYVIIARKD